MSLYIFMFSPLNDLVAIQTNMNIMHELEYEKFRLMCIYDIHPNMIYRKVSI